jgi:hypothetical protein
MFRNIFIGVLGICLTLVSGTSAYAIQVCAPVRIGGKTYQVCTTQTGSLTCDLTAKGVGNCDQLNNTTVLGCCAIAEPFDGETTPEWVVACVNKSEWAAPGIQTAYFNGAVSGGGFLQQTDCEGKGIIPDFKVYTDFYGDLLGSPEAQAACPNEKNWEPVDAVPCRILVTDYAADAGGNTLDAKTFICELPNCESLGYDSVTKHFDVRQYDCEEADPTIYQSACQ